MQADETNYVDVLMLSASCFAVSANNLTTHDNPGSSELGLGLKTL